MSLAHSHRYHLLIKWLTITAPCWVIISQRAITRMDFLFCAKPMRVVAALFLLIISATAVAQETLDDFAWRAPLQTVGTATWYALPLPLSVQLAAKTPDLADLRVFNAQGESVPYSVTVVAAQPAPTAKDFSVNLFPLLGGANTQVTGLHVRTDASGTVIDVGAPASSATTIASPTTSASTIGNAGAGDATMAAPVRGWLFDTHALKTPLQTLKLNWQGANQGFWRFRIESSNDLQTWRLEKVGQVGTIAFNGEQIEQHVTQLGGVHAAYLRLLWQDSVDEPTLSAAAVTTVDSPVPTSPLNWSKAQAPAQTDAGDPVWELPRTVPLARLRLDNLPANTVAPVQVFMRVPMSATEAAQPHWQLLQNALVYRLGIGADEQQQTEINLPGYPITAIKLHVDPRGGGMGASPTLAYASAAQRIIFLARGAGPYTLAVGAPQLRSAALPLTLLVPAGSDNAVFGAASLDGALRVGSAHAITAATLQPNWRRFLLWGILMIGVMLLAAMAWQLLRGAKPD